MDVQNVENGLLVVQIDIRHIRTYHKELSIEQQSKLKCKIQRSIVHDYLETISEYNAKYQ